MVCFKQALSLSPFLNILSQVIWIVIIMITILTHFRLMFHFYIRFFISNTWVKSEKNKANVKQHPDAELLLFENYSHSSWMLSSKNNRTKISKIKRVSVVMRIIWLLIMKMKMKMKSISHRYDISRTRSRQGHKYGKCKNCLSMIMLIRNKQHIKLRLTWKKRNL